MARAKGDGKKIPTVNSSNDYDYRYPSDVEWLNFQRLLGEKLSKELRDHIAIITMYYAMGGEAWKGALTATAAAQAIKRWQVHTNALRTQLTDKPIRRLTPSERNRKREFYSTPFQYLVAALDDALARSSEVAGEISNPGFQDRRGDRWSIWVALTIECGLRSSNRKICSLTAQGACACPGRARQLSKGELVERRTNKWR
jgi:hypothetical protein